MEEMEIQRKRRENEELATASRAQILGFQYLDTRKFEQDIELVQGILDLEQMHKDFIIPLKTGDDGDFYEFMITSQTPRSVINELRKSYVENGDRVKFYLVSMSAYKIFMLRYDPPKEVVYDDIKIAQEGDSETLESVSKTLNSVASDRVFDFLMEQADKLTASDIHIENLRNEIRVRMRVDGILHPVATLEKDRYRVLVGELALRAGLSSASSKPQSGHIQKEIFDGKSSHILNIRVEMIPTMYGQDAVMRLFNFDESLLNLNLLGITDSELAILQEIISHPRGLVMMVGPTGSGKSTTLYSIINALNTTDRKIITLEDPVEYSISGISQVPVDTGRGGSFAENLRSVLRLDPDVVMVGEIRDADTARTAIQASITGHLVLSSFHANSTAAAFARMIDLIGMNPVFSNSVRLLIAQRLVRKLAPTKEEIEVDKATEDYIRRVLEGIDTNILEKDGIDLNNIKLWGPVSSEEYPFGYDGRIALMEQLQVSERIAAFIRGDVADFDTSVIEKAAREEGMLTLEQKGVLAALRGETTLDETGRVI